MLTSTIYSQELTPSDALRYAMDNITGTARFRSMSGAFGALGGDMSSLSINPAGSAVFNHNQGTVTLSSLNTKNNANYFGTQTSEKNNTIDINQAGVVFVFLNEYPNSKWNKFSIGVNYENTNNFNNDVFVKGINPTNSIDKYFLRYANGLPSEGGIFLSTLNNAYFGNLDFIDQQALLGYQAFIFNPVDADNNDNTVYVSNVPTNSNYYQESYIATNGYNGKLTFNVGAAYNDKFYFGLNLNSHFSDFTKSSAVYEAYDTDPTTGLQSVQFDNLVYTYGNGFSMNLGVIGKVTNDLRLGLAYESPTWMKLRDQLSQRVIAYCPDCGNNNPIIYNPNLTTEFESYRVKTPGKYTFSGAYTFNKKGLISIDYAIKDYGNTRFRQSFSVYSQNSNSYLESLNSNISNNMTLASEIRIGGEYKYKMFSFRGGYRYEQSPYKNDAIMGDLTGYSGGLGFNFGESKLDLAYSSSKRKQTSALISSGMNDVANINALNKVITLTYSINF